MKKMILLGLAALSLAACQDDETLTTQQQQEKTFAEQFAKAFKTINPYQEWDFSTGEYKLLKEDQTRAATSINLTQVDGIDWGTTYTTYGRTATIQPCDPSKNKTLYQNIANTLPDGKKHTGEPAVLVATGEPFYIYPLTEQGAYTYDVYVKVGDQEQKLFTKAITDYSRPYVNKQRYNKNTPEEMMYGMKVEAPVGTAVQIYLKNVKYGSTNQNADGRGTGTGNAIYVDCQTDVIEGLPSDLGSVTDCQVKYIGIEDGDLTSSGTDFDYNDLTLMVIGKEVPEQIVVEEDNTYTVNESVSKRYMVEDLGSTGDFDFNDVVIDLTENKTETYKVSGTEVTLESTTKTQKLALKHLGGTMTFSIYVGSELIVADHVALLDRDIEGEEWDITSWVPEENNIKFVFQTGENDGVYEISFPDRGKTPLMLATDTTQAWMAERTRIDWLESKMY